MHDNNKDICKTNVMLHNSVPTVDPEENGYGLENQRFEL